MIHLRTPSHSLPRQNQRGFALIVTIVLVAFLVLILLGLATFTRVETQVATNSQSLSQARQNAVFALNIAVGQLQKYAGPDQRVTAPATTVYPSKDVTKGTGDLYDNTTYGYRDFADIANTRSYLTNATTYLVPNERNLWDSALKTYWNSSNRQARYTAVFNSSLRVDRATNPNALPSQLGSQQYGDADGDGTYGELSDYTTTFGEFKRDQIPVWLVSGSEKYTVNQNTGVITTTAGAPVTSVAYEADIGPTANLPDPATSNDSIWLVDKVSATLAASSSDGLDGRVKVRKQKIKGPTVISATSNETIGNYAYWVGDESQKSNFAVRDPYAAAVQDSPEYRNRLQVPQRLGWERMLGFFDQTSGAAYATPNDPKFLKVLTANQIPFVSTGNSTQLAAAIPRNFHNITAFSKTLLTDTALGGLKKDLTAYLERSQGPSNSDPIADPGLYNTTDPRFRAWGGTNAGFPNSTAAALDGIPNWGQLKAWYTNESAGSTGAITPSADAAPVLTYLMFHSGMSYDFTTKKIRWHWLPCVVLWNPYNVPLSPATYDMEVGLSPWIWQMMFVKENPTLAELQKDVAAQWTGAEGVRTTYTFLDSDGVTRKPLIITANPDSINMSSGPWPFDNNLADGTTDAFGRYYYYCTKADANMYQEYQGNGGAGNLSAIGNKAIPIIMAPHDGPAFASSKLPVDRPLKFQLTSGFGAGEARVFTVPNDVKWTSNSTVALTNQFQSDSPASLWFDLLNVAEGPASATTEGVKWFYAQVAQTVAAPTVRLSIGGNTIFESKTSLGGVGFNKTTQNSSGRDLTYYFDYGGGGALSKSELDFDGDTRVNREEPMPSFISAWKPLYDFNDFADKAITLDTDNTASSIYGYGETFIRPILPLTDYLVGGGIYNEENHQCLPVFSRFNLGAKSFADHPMVDFMRDFYGANNYDYTEAREGLTKFSFIKSIDMNQTKWDDDQSDGNLGFALITERDFRPQPGPDYSYNRYKPISKLAIRNAKRADSEILSLGQFQQANLSPYFWQPSFPIGNSDAGIYNDREAIAGINSRKVGSARPPDLQMYGWITDYPKAVVKPNNAKRTDGFKLNGDPNGVTVDVPGNSMMDMSYLLNENLWDRYFLSTIAGTPDLAKPLPNSRLRFTGEAASAVSALTEFDNAAAYLQNVGALNVNSTSVEAWKSLLTAFRDLKLKSQSGSENPAATVPVAHSLSPIQDPIDFTPTTRDAADYGNVTGVGSKDYTKVVSGFRYLDDTMIQTLAERIVDEVRLRGPFLSLADFVNRRLVAPQGSGVTTSDWYQARTTGVVGIEGDLNASNDFMNPSYDPFIGLHGINGSLQRAINLSGINGGLNHPKLGSNGTATGDSDDRVFSIRMKNGGTDDNEVGGHHSSAGIGGYSNTQGKHSTDPSMRSHIDSEHLAGAAVGEAGQLLQGTPGFVTQGDLLAMLGPALTPRGDTFLIRTYGDAINPATEEILGRAWLEAVVQRVAEPVTPSASDPFRPADAFGRKFKVVSFRWLNEAEL